jgi:hypothetical protein
MRLAAHVEKMEEVGTGKKILGAKPEMNDYSSGSG